MSQFDPASDANDLHGTNNGGPNNGGATTALTTIESQLPAALPAAAWGYGLPQRPEILSAKPNPVDLMHAMRRRWPLAVGIGSAVGLIAAAIVWFVVPIKYEAYALLNVEQNREGVLDKTTQGREVFEIFKRTQAALVTSGSVLRNAIREPAVMGMSTIKDHDDDPAGWLSDQVIVDYPNDAEVMRVAVKTPYKNEAVKLVDTIVAKYLSEVVMKERDERYKQEDDLKKRYDTIVQEFKTKSKTLFDLEQSAQVESTAAAEVKRQIAQDSLINALTERSRIQSELRATELDIAIKKSKADDPDALPPDVLIEMELRNDPVIQNLTNLKSDYAQALARLNTVTKNPAASRDYQRLNAVMNELDMQIEEHKAESRPHVIDMLKALDEEDERKGSGATTLKALETKLGELQAAKKTADDEVLKRQTEFKNFETHDATITAQREELATLNQTMNQVRSQIQLTELERMAQERITKIDDAVLTSQRGDAIKKYVAVLFSAVLGFSVVVLGIAYFEFQSRKLNDVHQVDEGLGIKVIGELPSVRGRKWRKLKGGKGPSVLKALMAERIDGTRTALIHSTANQPPRVVMVTSADPHEGKTTTSSQLAASLARAGRRTLLIDADIRNPGVHRVFDMPLEPGLSELLRGEADRDAVVHPTRTANLWLLPAGRCDLRSVQSLSTSYLGTSIAALCVQFDYVVIDSGPVLKVADSLLVGQHVDAAILSVLKDASKVPHVYEACERLRSVGINVMGAVVNGVNDDAARHGMELLMNEATT
jgi:capsular exopolysaccharide synthesis family protein